MTSIDKKPHSFTKPVNSFATNVNSSQPRCVICPNDRHPLYVCDMFRNLSSTAITIEKKLTYMTCKIRVTGPDDSSAIARALIDTGSGASFITERLARTIQLHGTKQKVQICGISCQSVNQADTFLVNFQSFVMETLDVTALVLNKVTRDLPTDCLTLDTSWTHLQDIPLADPTFGSPGKIDAILGAELFNDIMRHGQRYGHRGSPTAWETEFGWVLNGATQPTGHSQSLIATCHAITSPALDTLRHFWEIEETSRKTKILTSKEKFEVNHFQRNHKDGRYIVPLPRKTGSAAIGESRSQAVR